MSGLIPMSLSAWRSFSARRSGREEFRTEFDLRRFLQPIDFAFHDRLRRTLLQGLFHFFERLRVPRVDAEKMYAELCDDRLAHLARCQLRDWTLHLRRELRERHHAEASAGWG